MSDEPNQLIISKEGLSRLISYSIIEEELAIHNHQAFSEIVKELTGDWLNEIECKDIQQDSRFNYDEVVYLGSQKHLKEGGLAYGLKQASMWDKYKFDLQRNGYWYSDIPKCRTDKGLDPDEPYIIWYNGEYLEPYIFKVEEQLDADKLIYETTLRTVLGTPMWGQRANSAIFELGLNALVYMTPEMLEADDWSTDWRVKMMVGTIDYMEQDHNNFIPLVVPFEQPVEHILVPNLS